ncbi:MAG: hypothetical protein JNK61_04525 [Bacteroidia bacterium]|nr:hypothetical protein [Bacteroidia bacterium]
MQRFKKNNFPFLKGNVLIAALILSLAANGQDKKNKNYEWGSLGMGFGLDELGSDVTTRSFGVAYNRTIGSKGLFVQGNIQGTIYNDLPSLFALNFAPGYAKGLGKNNLMALSIGGGYMSGDAVNGKSYRAFGINSTLQLHYRPLGDLGLGVELYANYPLLATIGNAPASNGLRVVICFSSKPKP